MVHKLHNTSQSATNPLAIDVASLSYFSSSPIHSRAGHDSGVEAHRHLTKKHIESRMRVLVMTAVVWMTPWWSSVDAKPDSLPIPAPLSTPANKTVEVRKLYSTSRDSCLNSSGSHSWAQLTPDGKVGIVYRETQGGAGDSSISQLVLKTITPDGRIQKKQITHGTCVENSVLLYDALLHPHIFTLLQNGVAQDLLHFTLSNRTKWHSEKIAHFANSKGEYVYELAAALGPKNSLHLAVLQFGSTPDHYLVANENSNLFYMTNLSGAWKQELVQHYDSVYILMNIGYWYMRPLRRQDLVIDNSGHAHIAYGALVREGFDPYPTEMRYATNASGKWEISTALPKSDTSCDAGYNPSIAIDSHGRIAMACTYVERVPAKSAQYSQLIYAQLNRGKWTRNVLVTVADNYFGYDEGQFTGAIPHLCFDKRDRPHIVFSDIASSHVREGSFLNVGQIRYIHYNGVGWELSTLYHQPSPYDYNTFSEIHSICLMLSPTSDEFQIIAEEYIGTGSNRTFNLLHLNSK